MKEAAQKWAAFVLPKYQMENLKHGYFELSNAKIISRSNAAIMTLAEAKAHLRVPFDDEDDLITDLIGAAQDHIEKIIECPITEASMALSFDIPANNTSPFDRIYIPVRNATSVESATFDGVMFDPSTYTLNTFQSVPFITLTAPLKATSITILLTAGFASVPADIKAAGKLLIGHWYKNTEAVASGTANQPYAQALAVNSLLDGYKLPGIA